jgi:8-oxo-dGTP pyrophosphatase MutT (NUDIX family)
MGDKFQTNFEIIRLYDENEPPPPVTKVGILPFVVEGEGPLLTVKMLLMKPRAEAKHLEEPAFQLAKGTRRIHINDGWCDMRADDLIYADPVFWESLVATALREGEEEVGLKPGNILRLFDAGGFTFTSATRNIQKPLHMFAAEMKNMSDFGPFEASTLAADWFTLEEFARQGREDHVGIAETIVGRLMKYGLK